MKIRSKIILGSFILGALFIASFFIFQEKALVLTVDKLSIQNQSGTEVFMIDDQGNLSNFGADYDLFSLRLPATSKPASWLEGFELRNDKNEIIFYVEENGNVHANGDIQQGDILKPGDTGNLIIKNNIDKTVAYIDSKGGVYLLGSIVADGNNIAYAFVTNGLTLGSLGGLSGADNFCASQAAAGGLKESSTYKAWLSDNVVHAKNRLDHMDGYQFATLGTVKKLISIGLPLDGSLHNPIDHDQFGNIVPTTQLVFTGTDQFGNKVNNQTCNNWTSSLMSAMSGQLDQINANWTNYISSGCNINHRIYCFKQPVALIP